jgi:polyisoprenoid-binding protein YceI
MAIRGILGSTGAALLMLSIGCRHNPPSVAWAIPGTPSCRIEVSGQYILTNPPTLSSTAELTAQTAYFQSRHFTYTWAPLLGRGRIVGSGKAVKFDMTGLAVAVTDVTLTVTSDRGESASCDQELRTPAGTN